MKLFLLQLTAYSLVATSGEHAHVQPSSALRGPGVMAALQATCEDGWAAGTEALRDLWEEGDSNCDNVWGLESAAEEMKDEDFPSGGDWRTASYNECARDAIDAEVERIEKECLEDDSSQCSELGYAAAEMVVKDNWCTPGSTYGATSTPDYKAECKEAATSICEGQIPTVANRWCPDKTMSTSQLLDLQDECEDQVDSMVPGEEVE